MPKGCLAALFGIYDKPETTTRSRLPVSRMNEGDIHSGPGGYEGMGYQGGYAHDYLNQPHEDDTSFHGDTEN